MNERNPLWPIFLRMDRLPVLVVGGGAVAAEKLQFMLKSSPRSQVTLVAREVSAEVRAYEGQGYDLRIVEAEFGPAHLLGHRLVLAATDQRLTNEWIACAARRNGCLVNVADTPDLCDFYLGSVITKGNLKVGVSTNGKSPTLAKRFRQFLEAALPEETEQLLVYLNRYRNVLAEDFAGKVKALEQLTRGMVE
ncbi:MAG: bifunctional precorrin-2 dehydrogenase/sirohydrochlorin ferrochelatase [Bacteroidota bacterium]